MHVTFDYEFSFANYLKYGLITGLLFGLADSIVEYYFERYIFHRLAMWTFYTLELITFIIVFAIVLTLVLTLFDAENETQNVTGNFWWLTEKFFWATVFYAGFISSGLSFIKIATERFGRNVFFKILTGRYREPKEKNRIFMFLDLKSSTTIAEKLGHFKHSQFIQDCFYDLNEVVLKYDAEIYQYVGDEAVLTWDYDKGLINNNCIDMFFAFIQKQQSKANYYQEKYGVVPVFKAGVHGGKLMVAEVGTVKKEIAYHGDVINTTARIQSKCNEYQQLLLISESLLSDLNIGTNYYTENIGELSLKGKESKVVLLGIKMKETVANKVLSHL